MSTKTPTSASSTTDHHSGQSESAREAKRTWVFVVVAIGCLLITGLFEWMSRPAAIEEYGKVGQEFYPDFTDPTTATSLTVSVIDPEEVKPLEFSVKQAENGQWVIPSHHNYPADAADQLAKTAGSVIGIKRGAMVTRWASDHARYGVVDPETETVGIDELEGIGKRITLGGKDDSVLASYIVGKKVDGEGNRYYVRHPGEDETYIADLDINLTTRFSDWVNTDLLDITNADVRRIELNDYSFDEIRGTVTGNVQSILSRDSATDDWKLAGMDDATQEVNEDDVRETLNTLSSLEIVGVRPKQPGLTADLRIDRSALKSQRDADRLTNDLLARGFLLQPNPDDKNLLELIAREGEMFVGVDDGLLYRLYFGRVFTGSEQELEIGLNADNGEASKSADDDKGSDDNKTADGDKVSEQDADKDDATTTGKPGRYVFVRVNFDPTLLGEALTEPVEPREPEEIKTLEEKIKQAEANGETANDEAADSEKPAEESSESAEQGDDASEVAEEKPAETDAQKLQRLREDFAAAKAEYRTQLAAFQEYQQKVKDGEKKSEELNRRFALWYYVIPGDSYDKLSLSRDDLIKAKDASEDAAAQASDGAMPTIGELSEAVMKESDAPASEDNVQGTSPDAPQEEPAADQPEAADGDKTDESSAEAPAAAEDSAPAAEPAEPAVQDAPETETEPPASETDESPAQDADSSADLGEPASNDEAP